MLYYFQNLKRACDRIVQLIKEPVSASELFNYKHRIIRLKIYRAIFFINLLGLLNLNRGYILAHLINNLVNLI